jgi:glycosyltransferase involved in cell wall biosynthesis
MLSQLGETWVVTRSNNRPAIDHALATTGVVPNLHFVYVDLPPSLRRWKRGQRGVRLYYVLWQLAAFREARELTREQQFDLAWHLTFANAWIGSLACRLGLPFVYGPVGGGVGTPWRLSGTLGALGTLYELGRTAVRAFARYLNPLARASWRRASVILVQNEETKQWLPRRYRSRAEVFANVVIEDLAEPRDRDDRRVMLFAGRLQPLKGVSLVILALNRLPEWKLIVCGDGPDMSRLQRLTWSRGLAERVEFRGWVPREEVLRTMRDEGSVLVFPSLHDEAGWAVAEAMASGLPVVCLNIGGPPAIAGTQFAVPLGSPGITAARLAQRVIASATEADTISIQVRAREFMFEQRVLLLGKLLEAHLPRAELSVSGGPAEAG